MRKKRSPRNIPPKIKEAVFKRDNYTCVKCGYHGDPFYLEADHILPWSKGGHSTYDNLQTLCGKCNRLKRDKTPYCAYCGEWAVPGRPFCSKCGKPVPVEIEWRAPKSILDHFISLVRVRAGHLRRAAMIAALVCVVLIVGALAIGSAGRYWLARRASSSPNVAGIINETVNINPNSIYPIRFTIPNDAVSGRVAGGFRVTSGDQVNALVINEKDYQALVKNSPVSALYESGLIVSKKINRKLDPGSYYLIFRNQSPGNTSVAAEFYVGHK